MLAHPHRLLLFFTLCIIAAAGCGDDDPVTPGPGPEPELAPEPAPEFALVDVNATSATFDQAVSPRDYLQKVSAWYFGHAT